MLVKTLKSNEAYRAFASKCLNSIFQYANCLILDAHVGGKVNFIWSEIFFSKGQNFKEKVSSSSCDLS